MTLNWTIIGTGTIANEMATAFNKNHTNIYGVFSRNKEKVEDFANRYLIDKRFNDLEDVFLDKNVDAVYIATPHNTHFDIAKQALINGKHVFMEKAITLNKTDLDILETLAFEKNLILMEAMTIVHMPLMKELKKKISQGELGDIKNISVTHGSFKPYDEKNRFFNPDLGGGVLLDMGVYGVTGAMYFMNKYPDDVHSFVDFAPTTVDEQSVTILYNSNGEMATVSVSLQAKQPKALTISGTKGYFRIHDYPRADSGVWYHTETGKTEELKLGKTEDALFYEILDFEEVVKQPGKLNIYKQITDDVFKIFEEMKKDWSKQISNK
ncbi:Gfo/Idh/MocA family protein [Periweissella ghanensis]|uniref:Scyllo-inositol 2-dehydrogenase (NADP(+)) IolU n=1 Tax=Periweissella ghanensis TaxID=467997 RepID=A0ABM8ZDZ3_9LACO|nr:Gfo/Idh/MocA family oxidoreductase [Periweissella ghanensis]MCM0601408.1 Gfo/Idh/MocA family oxidoreductase [Periweissella ghanensis]CAH0419468.1 scyllo-inositol 2-dehydrogenase (NADP(+)) IolU [Periweissella ghanensis]